MFNNNNINLVEDKDLCARCKGECCKNRGCHLAPSDIFRGKEPSIEILREFMNRGNYAIDFFDGLDDGECTYYVHTRQRNEGFVNRGVILPFTPCSLLTPSGCKLSFEERPTGGKALVPVANGLCKQTYDLEDCCRDWLPYQEMLKQVAYEFIDVDPPQDPFYGFEKGSKQAPACSKVASIKAFFKSFIE